MLKKILIGLGALVVVLAVIVSMQPAEFSVERSAAIQAPSSLVYAYIASPRAHEQWSPFMKMDPVNQKNTYTGPQSGVGAVCSWEGGDAGAGRLTIVGAKPNEQLDMRLEMTEPMQADNRVTFTLAPAGGATTVTWRIEGENSFVSKAAGMVMDMDEMVGGEFEKGLAALKTLAESGTAAPSPAEG